MNREILRLAVPNILSNISVPLLSSVDTALMGNVGGGHIAAVGLGSMAFNFLYWNFGFLRMGSTGLTAQAFGRDSRREMANVLGRAALVAGLLAVAILLFQGPFFALTRVLLNVKAAQLSLVSDYFFIRVWAAPATLGLMVLFGWFFGMQNAWLPLLLTLTVNLVNISLSYYLVQQGWGIDGVAWGTVLAQYVGLAVALLLLVVNFSWLRAQLRLKLILLRRELLAFLRVNGDIFLRTLCLTLGFTFFYNRANAMPGEAIVAANVILLQLVNWLSYGVDGFAFAAESLVGKYHGAGNQRALDRAVQLSFRWGIGLGLLYALGYWWGDASLVALFADEQMAPATLATGVEYLPAVLAFCLLATPCYILDGIFIGLTAARAMRQTMLLAFGAYLLTYFAVGQYYANWGLWASMIAFMVYRAALQGYWYRRGWLR